MPSDLFPSLYSTVWASQPSPGGVDPNRDQILVSDAYSNALHVVGNLRNTKDQVRGLFPHRTEAIALAKEITRILFEQHGGESPFNLLFEWARWDCRGLLSRQDSLAMVRVWRRWSMPQVEQEFGPLYRLKIRGRRAVHSEKWIDGMVEFMRRWIQDQRNKANLG